MLRFLLIPLVALGAYADSITVEITPERRAIVREHFSSAGPLVYLATSCARMEKLESIGNGPWIDVRAASGDVSYAVVTASRECSIPLVMPKRAIDSVSITITDRGSGLRSVTSPHFIAHRESRTWTSTFPAVPSALRLEWETGDAPPMSSPGPIGLFAWNFWGLTGILVTWTIAYLFWARAGRILNERVRRPC